MAITLDGKQHIDSSGGGGVTPGPISLVTTKAKDIIVYVFACENTASPHVTLSAVSATGLTFTRRASIYLDNVSGDSGGPCWNTIEIWSAQASAAGTYSISCTKSGTLDIFNIDAFGVNFDGVSYPVWSSNASLPKTNSSSSATASAPSATGISTNAAAMVIAFGQTCSFTVTMGAATGYTLIESNNDGSGVIAVTSGEAYQVFATAQSSISVALTGAQKTWSFITDALEAPSGGDTLFGGASRLFM